MFLKVCVLVLLLATLFAVGGTAAYGDRAIGLIEGLAAERGDPYNQLMALRGDNRGGGIAGVVLGVFFVAALLASLLVAYRFAAQETRSAVREVRLMRRKPRRVRPSADGGAS